MLALKIIFWFFLFIIFYAYFGYGMLLYLLILIKRKIKHSSKNKKNPSNFPEVTLMVASYNEKDFIKEKINNSMELDYPKDKLKHLNPKDYVSFKNHFLVFLIYNFLRLFWIWYVTVSFNPYKKKN